MSGTISSTAASSTAAAASAQTGQNALLSLTNNFQTFLGMLTTQLQNQDPTSPMDSNAFTTELVQFAGVEQQISTNADLTQMVQLMQGNNVLQSSQILGKTVQATSSNLSLQNSHAQIDFTAPSAGTVAIAVTDSNGNQVYNATLTAAQGANTWTWNGQTSTGAQEPDGSYGVTVNAVAANGSTSALPFTIQGTATAVQQQGSTVQVELGALAVNMANVTGVLN